MPPRIVRHPIARAAVIGGVGYHVGKRSAAASQVTSTAPPSGCAQQQQQHQQQQQPVTIRITCPQGSGPGSQLQVQYDGASYNVIIPAGVRPGQQFDVAIQPRAIPTTVGVAAEEEPPMAVAVAASATPKVAPSAAPKQEASTSSTSSWNPFASANPFKAAPSWAADSIKAETDQTFASLGPSKVGTELSLSPAQVSEALLPFGVPTSTLSTIWELSDIEKDGRLDADEFCVAVYLCRQVQAGHAPPSTLPAEVVPPSKRGQA